jgi:hypothetical protein
MLKSLSLNCARVVTGIAAAIACGSSTFATTTQGQPPESISITSITGVSSSQFRNDGTVPYMWGEFIGPAENPLDPAKCQLDGVNLCNNCTSTSTNTCSEKRIYGDLQFSITFTVTADIPAGYAAYLGHSDMNFGVSRFVSGSAVTAEKGLTVTLTGKWDEICMAAGLTSKDGEPCAWSKDSTGADVNLVIALSPRNSSHPFTSSYKTEIVASLLPLGGHRTFDTLRFQELLGIPNGEALSWVGTYFSPLCFQQHLNEPDAKDKCWVPDNHLDPACLNKQVSEPTPDMSKCVVNDK